MNDRIRAGGKQRRDYWEHLHRDGCPGYPACSTPKSCQARDNHTEAASVDTAGTAEIVCPWCGAEDRDSWEYREDSADDEYCDECGNTFKWERHTQVTYTSERVQPETEQP